MHETEKILERLGVPGGFPAVASGGQWAIGGGAVSWSHSPIDGAELAGFQSANPQDVQSVIAAAHQAFSVWRSVPAPRRGELVRLIGQRIRQHKADLASLITWEAGKIRQEALGEVQEMVDICDFAVGLSRQLYGLTIASERTDHRLMEQWHPLGPVGVITAFNFPMAVWAWNAMIGIVCGDPIVWKPSEKTPLCAFACHALAARASQEIAEVPQGLFGLVVGDAAAGQALAESPELPLISATGSVRMGQVVAPTVAKRLGRSLLELGGNNAAIVTASADIELAVRGIVFSAVGTCGQRCTTLRRLIVHRDIATELLRRLVNAYKSLPIGNPLDEQVLVGPLIDENAWKGMEQALQAAAQQGGQVLVGGHRVTEALPQGGYYVRPAMVEINADAPIVQQETFAPILYAIRYEQLDQAIAIHNRVPQGLSSSIFTNDLREAERFCSASGSDCGIVNVNAGPSGAEIGGAFGGEKQTGGGRESGSDAWKGYMRRTTNTINYSSRLPLAQGIKFDV